MKFLLTNIVFGISQGASCNQRTYFNLGTNVNQRTILDFYMQSVFFFYHNIYEPKHQNVFTSATRTTFLIILMPHSRSLFSQMAVDAL